MLSSRLGDKFLFLVAKSANELYEGATSDAAEVQRRDDIGGEDVRLFGELYRCLKVEITNCSSHDEIRLGMTEAQFLTEFQNGGGGFTISFSNTTLSIPIAWRDMIDHPL